MWNGYSPFQFRLLWLAYLPKLGKQSQVILFKGDGMVSLTRDWEWFFRKLREMEQVADRNHVEIRSVMTRNRDWMHYATCLYIPSRLTSNESSLPDCMIYPDVALLAKEVPFQAITSFESIIDQIQAWEVIDECKFPHVKEPNSSIHMYFHGSHNDFGDLPV